MTTFPSDWVVHSIGDLCDRVTSGGTPSRSRREFYAGGTIPWVKTGELRDGYVMASEEMITPEAVKESSAKLLPESTVLMAMYGATVGALGILGVPATCNQASCAMIVDPLRASARWLFYSLLNDRSRIVQRATGAAQQNLSGRTVQELKYVVPPLHEQQAIAAVLGALDDKVAANTNMAEASDALIRAEFQAVVQKGVENVPLLDVVTIEYGGSFKGTEFAGEGVGRPLIRIRDLKSFRPQTWTTESRPGEVVVEPGDILIGMDGEFRATAWLGEPGLLNQRVCRIRSAALGAAFVREALRAPLAARENEKSATTVIHLNKSDLERTTIAVPSADLLIEFEQMAEPLFKYRVALAKQSRTLEEMRDTLLPELMSGRLRVKDAEKKIEGVI